MYSTFLVPLDGSKLAERALAYAVKLAEAAQGRLILVRAAIAPPPMTIDGLDWESSQRNAVEESERYLAAVAGSMPSSLAVETLVAYGRAEARILQAARSRQVDVIVMSAHGRTGLTHLVHRSVAEGILAHSQVPVLVVHARPGKQIDGGDFDVAAPRVLVPLDGSTLAEAALEPAGKLLERGGELVLLGVVEFPKDVLIAGHGRVLAYIDQQVDARTFATLEWLNGVAHKLRDQYPHAVVSTDVRLGCPAENIVAAAVEHGVGLIVMATHGRTGVQRAVLGSVTGQVLRSAGAPLLLVHPRSRATPVQVVALAPEEVTR